MDRNGVLEPRRLPLIVAILVVPTVAAAVIGGPGFGAAVAAVVLITMLIVFSRKQPDEPIETHHARDSKRRVLLVLSEPVKDAGTAHEVFQVAARGGEQPLEVLALAPTQPHFLDRWASDVRAANAEAREKLSVTIETLRHEHLEARAEIGDSDIVLAVEDALRDFPADEVILATGTPEHDAEGSDAAKHLQERLRVPFDHVITASEQAQSTAH